jgi:hypothetical protein
MVTGFLLGCILLNGCGQEIERSEADKIAQAALERYSTTHGLTLKGFSGADVVDHGNSWSYEYVYNQTPCQLVAVNARFGKMSHSENTFYQMQKLEDHWARYQTN